MIGSWRCSGAPGGVTTGDGRDGPALEPLALMLYPGPDASTLPALAFAADSAWGRSVTPRFSGEGSVGELPAPGPVGCSPLEARAEPLAPCEGAAGVDVAGASGEDPGWSGGCAGDCACAADAGFAGPCRARAGPATI